MKKKLPFLALATTASMIMAAPAAFAQDASNEEGLHFGARLGMEHDSNVLRQSGNTQSDTAWTAGVGIKYNKQFSLQRIRADVEWDTWRYNDHSELNFNTLNYSAAWDWSVTPRLHGTISADRRQYREVVTDPLTTLNLIGRRTERTELAEGAFDVAGSWQLLGGVSHFRAESTEPFSWDGLPDINYWQVGVGYAPATGSSVALRYKHGDGSYHDATFAGFGALNSDFKENEVELSARWAYSGKTTVDGRIAHVKREHSSAPQLDFSGVRGGVNVNWDVTAKTRVQAGWLHDVSATGLVTGGRVDSDRFFITPVWHWTAKTSFNARYDYTRREWKDVSTTLFPAGRTERVESLQAGVDWQALRTISLSGYIREEKQHSSIGAGYRATVYGVLARANF